ncbi:MAG: 1-aminocyclopropane-carboxylate deaminase [Gemmatimonadetes bacterium]|nr:1-aminocyclopropane-carboxylate deaminase [Gemmatimonadota bacterium]
MKSLFDAVPRVDLGVRETPVERHDLGAVRLLVKRDDLSSPLLGGNKVRALQFLLAGVKPGQRVLTVGSTGSTHALAVAQYSTALGAHADVITWPQEDHAVSMTTGARLASLARVTHAMSPVDAYLRAGVRRLTSSVCWIPAGGSSALGALGHVHAALELVSQLEHAGITMPHTLVVPLGSGGTAAGLLVGLSIAGVSTKVIGVRVVPKLVGNRWHVLRLAHRARSLLCSLSSAALPALRPELLEIDHAGYGGAYARETDDGVGAAALLRAAGGPRLDGTYSAKALGRALARARHLPDEQVLFWLTFDGRWLDDEPRALREERSDGWIA